MISYIFQVKVATDRKRTFCSQFFIHTFLLLSWILLFISETALTQPTFLNCPITAQYTGIPLGKVLEDLSVKSGAKFSYSPKKIPVHALINASFTNMPLSDVLDEVFKNLPVRYEVMDDYIILKKAMIEKIGDEVKETARFTINGYLKDNKTGELLIGATIYIKELELGTISNKYGYFSLTLPPGRYTLIMSYIGYENSEYIIDLASNMKFDIGMVEKLHLMEEVVITSVNREEMLFRKIASQSEILPESIKKQPAL